MRTPPLKRLSRRIARVRPAQQRVVSCYVRLTPEDRARRRYWRDVKAAVDALARHLPALERSARGGVARDLQRVVDYLSDPANVPHAPGLALFACSPVRLFAAVPLPHVARTRVAVARRPLLEELWAAERDGPRVLAVVLDRERARWFEVVGLDVRELASLRSPATRGGRYHSDRQDSPGWGERDFNNRIREERHRHYAAVVDRLAALTRDRPVEGILLAGPGDAAVALQRFLPPALAGKVLGLARLNPKLATTSDVATAVVAAHAALADRQEQELASAVTDGFGTGWAVDGLGPTLRALAAGSVRHLVVRGDASAAGFRCSATGRLVEAAGECRGAEGAAEPVPDLIGAMVQDAHRLHVPVTALRRPETGRAVDRVAALLRFR